MKRLLLALICLPLFAFAAPEKAEKPINLDIGTPPLVVVKHSLAQRQSRLIRFYDAGSIGMGKDGFLVLRDDSRLNHGLKKIAEKLVDTENNERRSLFFAQADANGGQSRLAEATAAQIQRWREQAHSGWWYEDDQGNWVQKP